jgi:hypothetical protein
MKQVSINLNVLKPNKTRPLALRERNEKLTANDSMTNIKYLQIKLHFSK